MGRKVRGTCFHLSNSIGHNSLWVFINGEAAETQASSLLPVGSSGLRGKVIWGVKSAVPINQGVGTKRKMETYNEKKNNIFGQNENVTIFIISFTSKTEKHFVSVFSLSGNFRYFSIHLNFHLARWEIAVDSLA